MSVTLALQEAYIGGPQSETRLGKKWETISEKQLKQKGLGACSSGRMLSLQVKSLSSSPSTSRKKRKVNKQSVLFT
jgi:hypothetical protein